MTITPGERLNKDTSIIFHIMFLQRDVELIIIENYYRKTILVTGTNVYE